MQHRSVGIDFGTTNSVLAACIEGQPKVLPIGSQDIDAEWQLPFFESIFPSVFAPDGNGWACGWKAKLRSADSVSAVKRLFRDESFVAIAGKEYSVEQIAGALFRAMKEGAIGLDFNRAVVTIPANSTGRARYRTRVCAEMADIGVRALVNEPTAAAMAYGFHNPGDKRMLVFDFGGGTLDVTVVEERGGCFKEEASKGAAKLGGVDVDDLLLRRMTAEVTGWDAWTDSDKRSFALDVERTKIRLSFTERVAVQSPDGSFFVMTRGDLEEVAGGLVQQSLEPLRQCLREAGGASGIDALLMVGGMSQMPLIRQLVSNETGLEPEPDINPMTAVAEGAAIASAILAGDLPSHTFSVVLEHALGVRGFDRRREKWVFDPIIERNATLPAGHTKVYFPPEDVPRQGTVVQLEVWEGDPAREFGHEDNIMLASFDITVPGPREKRHSGIETCFSYDESGVLAVASHLKESGEELLDQSVEFLLEDDPRRRENEAREIVDRFASVGDLDSIVALPEENPARSFDHIVMNGSEVSVRSPGAIPEFARAEIARRALQTAFPEATIHVYVDRAFPSQVTDEERVMVEQAIESKAIKLPKRAEDSDCTATLLQIAGFLDAAVVSNADLGEYLDDHQWLSHHRLLSAHEVDDGWVFTGRPDPAIRIEGDRCR